MFNQFMVSQGKEKRRWLPWTVGTPTLRCCYLHCVPPSSPAPATHAQTVSGWPIRHGLNSPLISRAMMPWRGGDMITRSMHASESLTAFLPFRCPQYGSHPPCDQAFVFWGLHWSCNSQNLASPEILAAIWSTTKIYRHLMFAMLNLCWIYFFVHVKSMLNTACGVIMSA